MPAVISTLVIYALIVGFCVLLWWAGNERPNTQLSEVEARLDQSGYVHSDTPQPADDTPVTLTQD